MVAKVAQCEQVSEPYSIIVTPLASPSDSSGSGPGCSTFAMSTVPSGAGAAVAGDSAKASAAAAARRTTADGRKAITGNSGVGARRV